MKVLPIPNIRSIPTTDEQLHSSVATGTRIFSLIRRVGFTLLLILMIASPDWARGFDEDEIPSIDDFMDLSLEDLANTEVISVSKKPEKLAETAAAIHVITQEEIRRSGATSIAELLRMVPGIHVAKIDSHTFAVSARGFTGEFANKLLVLIDGRSVYTPLFSGVYWGLLDTLLDDIERIEVIRGPGASVWGANAVNGVINIITKHAAETQGGLIKAGFGNEEKGFGAIRYGLELDDHAWLRAYTKFSDHDDSQLASGGRNHDGWNHLQGGFRLDWDATERDAFTIQGDLFKSRMSTTPLSNSLVPPYDSNLEKSSQSQCGNLLMRWSRTVSETSRFALQVYYDRIDSGHLSGLTQIHDTWDLDFQHQFHLGDRHDIVWGLGYRALEQTIDSVDALGQFHDNRHDGVVSGFVQNEITVIDELLDLTLGSKFEHNDYTGFEIQPTVRLLWRPAQRHTVWAATSRAVRTPSTIEADGFIRPEVLPPSPPSVPFPTAVTLLGSDEMKPESLVAWELGYRVQPTERISVDVATFFNSYHNLRTLESGNPYFNFAPTPHLVYPIVADNRAEAETYGVEVGCDWWMRDWWRFRANYTFMRIDIDHDSDSFDEISADEEKASPHHQLMFRSYLDITDELELDAGVRYVDRLAELDVNNYWGFDLRLGWRPLPDLEISLVGQNLTRRQHAEFVPDFNFSSAAEVEQSIYLQATFRF